MTTKITIGYIAREPEGFQAFRDCMLFVRPGMDYEMLWIQKGEKNILPWSPTVKVSDWGLGHRAHLAAMRHCKTEFYCGLNSWSRPLTDGWLCQLYHWVNSWNCGMVSCTGSAESFASAPGNFIMRAARRILFPPFPNYHLRMTGFCGRTKTLLKYWPTRFANKDIDELNEHGRNGVTARMKRDGLVCSIVGDCLVESDENFWMASNTYRFGNQERLLVADRQTDIYAQAGHEKRNELMERAWGVTYEPYPERLNTYGISRR